MAQETIFLPFLALGALTFTVLLLVPIRRFAAAAAGLVKVGDFALGESANVPGHVALANRNYMNLLELPVLFYAVCLAFFVTGGVSSLVLGLAWAYVGLRAAHSLVHLTANVVMVRLSLFAVSNAVLVALWVVFAMKVWRSAI
ncbi:MAG: MAPEG family protein [Caulobacter sp.]|nr:MAPEG family protein [Caulobacter sp.]